MKHLIAIFILVSVSLFAFASGDRGHSPVALYSVDGRLPGVALAEGVAEITGTAISPLLGVSSIGAWHYFRTPAAQRHLLPWYCHPLAWGIAFGILGLCFTKDLLGAVVPAIFKKPLDMLELFEDKLSALVASGAFVPLVAAEMVRRSQYLPAAPIDPEMPLHTAGFSFFSLAEIPWTAGIAVPVAIVGFFVVWLAAHGINVLIALSPFGIVDAVLKLTKAALLSSVVVTAFLNPVLSLVLCGTILVIAGLLAPWAFRLTLFGTLFAWDVLTFRKAEGPLTHVRVFSAGRFGGLPARTCGRLEQREGVTAFVYRPWLILPRCRVVLPEGLAISRGILYPSLLQCDPVTQRLRPVLSAMPRYRGREEDVAQICGITEFRDGMVMRGLRALRLWAGEMLNLGRRSPAPACTA